ncbi:MAG: SpoIIE family protein phosphatase [Crocinitomicaceae bacterium]|nr:SpoIIE family protein phosphatase [Crocinitomicaceae bacterium]
MDIKAVSNEKRKTHALIMADIEHHLETKQFNDSLIIQSDFALERARYNEEIAEIQNVVYLSVIGFIILGASLFFFVNSNRRRKRLNEILSGKNELIQEQKAIVDEKNKSISDSINYARRLQTAILPTTVQINEYLPESFLFFRPKDIVSGDFYWFEVSDDICFLAVADCTGHGVPGALVSVVCSNALNRSVHEFKIVQPKKILDKTRELVIDTFAKSGDAVADGMDISLMAINRRDQKVVFSGAHNSLWIIRDNAFILNDEQHQKHIFKGEKSSLIEFKGDKQPVGLYERMDNFTEQEIELKNGDTLYLLSDGFADQFGGKDEKKFKHVPFKRELLRIHTLSMEEQKEHLIKVFDAWKGELDQIDDVCVLGVRI